MSTSFATSLLGTPWAPGVLLLWMLLPHFCLSPFQQRVYPNPFLAAWLTGRRLMDVLPLAQTEVAVRVVPDWLHLACLAGH